MQIDIVTHCWSGDAVPIYHKLLWLQYLSLKRYPWSTEFRSHWWIFYTQTDPNTTEVLKRITSDWINSHQERLFIRPMVLPQRRLFRRAYGRNVAAMTSVADAIWFTDVDHLFFENSLSDALKYSIEAKTEHDADLIWPKNVNIHKRHSLGDAVIDTAFDTGLTEIIESDFTPRRERKAIGGIQIANGDYCRSVGYLNETKWMNPVDSDHFRQCHCDKAFRKRIDTKRAYDIRNVYRVRHSITGRDQGENNHGA